MSAWAIQSDYSAKHRQPSSIVNGHNLETPTNDGFATSLSESTSNRLGKWVTGSRPDTNNRLYNRFDNRLYRVNKHPTGGQTGCHTGLTTGWMFVYMIQPVVNRYDKRVE